MGKRYHFGYWWILPSNNSSTIQSEDIDIGEIFKIAGIISFNETSEISLELFVEPKNTIYFHEHYFNRDIPIICGIANSIKEGEVTTLLNCTNSGHSYSQLVSQKYSCKVAICHPKIAYYTKPTFKKVVFQHSQLNNWLRSSLDKGTIDIKLTVGEYRIRIYSDISTQRDHYSINKNQSVWMEFQSDSESNLEQWMEQVISPIGHFLTLATDHKSKITYLGFFSEDEVLDERDRSIPFAIFINGLDVINNKLTSSRLQEWEIFFSYEDITKKTNISVEDVLINWFALLKKTKSNQDNLIYLYTASKNLDYYQEPIFLNIVQALELYYNYKLQDDNLAMNQLSSDEFDSLKNLMKDTLLNSDLKIKEWVDEKIEYAFQNQSKKTLIDKLSSICELTSVVSKSLFQDSNKFCIKVRDTRNYYTHYGSGMKKKAYHGEELYWLTQAVSYLLLCCLLMEVKFDVSNIESILSRNNRYNFAKNKIQELFTSTS
jgi:ApeA N-terminal domain 1